MGRWVLREGCRQLAEWREAGLVDPERFWLSVNVSAREYQEPDLVEAVVDIAEESGVPPSALALEITESSAVDLGAGSKFQALRERGLRNAIDDFGTGSSSFEYLTRIEADMLKIDRSFVEGIALNRRQRGVVKGLVRIADKLGLMTIAEGIETEAQRRVLSDVGCPYGQGFHWGRPAPPSEIAPALRSGEVAEAS